MNPESLQKYLIESILELAFKQIIQYGPSVAKDVLTRANKIRSKQLFTPRVSLVDRKKVMDSIEFILKETSSLRILYLAGEGGVGKTRLLEETKKLIDNRIDFTSLRWVGILDLFHTELHSISAIQVAIVHGLDPAGVYFQDFLAAYERFNHLLAEGLIGRSLEDEYQKLNDLFFKEYEEFAKHYRSIIAFDTLDSLAHESDWVENLCRLEKAPAAIREWIICQINKLQNTVILLAGRPQPELESMLTEENSRHPGQMEIIPINGLTREETRQYLTQLLKKAPSSLKILNESADMLWQLTRGLPVQLSLAVELVSQGEYVVQKHSEFDGNVELWGQRLVSALFSYDHPARRIFFFLALARKGLTAELLHYLEPEWSLEDCRHQLEHLHESSIVKTRPGHEAIFLHDALYELYDAYFPEKASLKLWYERLADYYRAENFAIGPNHERGQTEINLLYYELCQSPRRAFESVYIPLRERAITGHELELDLQLRDELLRYLFRSSTYNNISVENPYQAEIDCDGVVRWVRRYVIQADYQQAIRVAEAILALGPRPYSLLVSDQIVRQARFASEQQEHAHEILNAASPLFWGQLLTYYCEALIYLDVPEFTIFPIIEQTITLLEDILLKSDHPLNWLRERVLGRVNDRLGYLLRSNGHYGRALKAYQDALQEFRNTDSVDEQAASMNNLAFVLALLGASKRAKAYIDQALELRQRLGQKYPLALSHNTRGLIYSQQGQHEIGRRECQLALSMFEELKTPRGIGLARNALGYILRKQGQSWKSGEIDPRQATKCFQQSIDYLEQAANVFPKIFPEELAEPNQVKEPIRSWEVFNEQGSLYREWGYLLNEQKDSENAQKLYARAVECQFIALEIARQNKMRLQEADSCDDLAKVLYDQGDVEGAHKWLEQAISLVPEEFIATPDQNKDTTPALGEAYWLILGKAYWQEGQWAIESISQEGLSERKYQEYTQNVIKNFTLAAYYFESYWPKTSRYSERLNLMKNDILKLRLPVRKIKNAIKDVAAYHKINVLSFLRVLSKS